MDEIPLAPAPVPKAKQNLPAAGKSPAAGKPAEWQIPRRGFFGKALAVAIGTLVGIVPLAAGAVVFLDPLRRKGNQFQPIRVTTLDALPADGIPRQFPVIADRQDAWNRFINEPIGSVFLRRLKGTDTVQAFNATCPHAGCFVAFQPEKKEFRCPCHTSAFQIDGQRVLPCVAPRGLDTLECEVRKVGTEQDVIVKFANFLTGIAEKKAKA